MTARARSGLSLWKVAILALFAVAIAMIVRDPAAAAASTDAAIAFFKELATRVVEFGSAVQSAVSAS